MKHFKLACLLVAAGFAATSVEVQARGGRGDEGRNRKPADPAAPVPPPVSAGERMRSLERALDSRDADEVRAALAALRKLETAAARDLLVAFVKTTRDDRLKAEALLALGWRGNRPAVELLTGKHGADSSRPRLVAAACRSLGAVGDPAVRSLLLERLREKDQDDGVVAGALAGLVALDPKAPDLPELLRLHQTHEAPEVRREVALGLGDVPAKDWRERLGALLDDDDPTVRAAVCEALGRRRDTDSLDALMRLQSEDPSEDVRKAALAAIMEIGDRP